MIGFLRGTVDSIYEDLVILDVNGVGYNVYMPYGSICRLSGINDEIKVYTYMAVREDAMQLYGFDRKDELDLFKLLIQVNGIGPKGALAILSTFSSSELRMAIISGDSKTISKAPGIGAKTAQRMIIDLKDKVSMDSISDVYDTSVGSISFDTNDSVISEAIEALTALGYSSSDAVKAVKNSGASKDDDVETVIKLAFKQLASI